MINFLRKLGWQIIELGVVVVLISIISYAILGADSGSAMSSISRNALAVLKEIPSGTVIGLVALYVIFHLYEKK